MDETGSPGRWPEGETQQRRGLSSAVGTWVWNDMMMSRQSDHTDAIVPATTVKVILCAANLHLLLIVPLVLSSKAYSDSRRLFSLHRWQMSRRITCWEASATGHIHSFVWEVEIFIKLIFFVISVKTMQRRAGRRAGCDLALPTPAEPTLDCWWLFCIYQKTVTAEEADITHFLVTNFNCVFEYWNFHLKLYFV